MNLIGIDVGGTHTRVRVQSASGEDAMTTTILSADWLITGDLGDPENAALLLAHAQTLGASIDSPLAVGAHGCDSPLQIARFRAAIEAHHSGPIAVVNDAFLLAPAAGVQQALGVIAGTGSIVVGEDEHGTLLTAGGLGWMIGDPGSAPGLVREALRAVVRRHDSGQTTDELGRILLEQYDAENVEDLIHRFTHLAGIHYWAKAAPHVFVAADLGAEDAVLVIRNAAFALAEDVQRLILRGARAEAVVTAGGVMVNQPRMQRELDFALRKLDIDLPLHVLSDDPVSGAIELARRLAANAAQLPPIPA